MTADKRRKWCDVATNLEGKTFTTEHVWTIHIWQHLIDFSQYKLNLVRVLLSAGGGGVGGGQQGGQGAAG
jgi:hypothetical protein